jgi:hypothetical protein
MSAVYKRIGMATIVRIVHFAQALGAWSDIWTNERQRLTCRLIATKNPELGFAFRHGGWLMFDQCDTGQWWRRTRQMPEETLQGIRFTLDFDIHTTLVISNPACALVLLGQRPHKGSKSDALYQALNGYSPTLQSLAPPDGLDHRIVYIATDFVTPDHVASVDLVSVAEFAYRLFLQSKYQKLA